MWTAGIAYSALSNTFIPRFLPLPAHDLIPSPSISDQDAILYATDAPCTPPELTPSPTTIPQDFAFGSTVPYERMPFPNANLNILSGKAPNTFFALAPTPPSQTHCVVQSGPKTSKKTKSTTPYGRSSSSQSAAKRPAVPNKSDRTYLLMDPSTEAPGGSGAASTWILMEKDTGHPATHLLKEVKQDRFSTWWRSDDGSRSKLMGHWWCRTPGCEYHTRRNADMDDHVLTHQDDSGSIMLSCKTWDGPPCSCSEGFTSKYKRSVKRHCIEFDSKKANTR